MFARRLCSVAPLAAPRISAARFATKPPKPDQCNTTSLRPTAVAHLAAESTRFSMNGWQSGASANAARARHVAAVVDTFAVPGSTLDFDLLARLDRAAKLD